MSENQKTRRPGGGRHQARAQAVQALYQWQLTRQAPEEIEKNFIPDDALSTIDVEYFRQLIREIPRHAVAIDARLGPHLDRGLASVDPVERAILRLGAYELEFCPEIPYRVILNEAIELAKIFGADQGHKYVNAVLDRLALELRAQEMTASA